MALLFLDGFDKYGGLNSNTTVVPGLLTAGEWTSWSASGATIVAGLSSTGNAVQVGTSSTGTKTLAANYTRLIGGLRFSGNLGAAATLMQFRDGANPQASITLETTGIVNLRNGLVNGTILASSSAVTANSTHYLEWDVTFGNTAAYQVWLDGVSAFSGTGDTTTTANNYANAIAIAYLSSGSLTVDDLYLFDATGTTNNAVLLTSPRIETTFPTSDSAVQFGFGAGILGSSVARSTSGGAGTISSLMLRRFTPSAACTLNSVSIVCNVNDAILNLRPAVYADSSGLPGSLLSSGSTVTGATIGVPVIMALTTPQALTAGTQYWLGAMVDRNDNFQLADGLSAGYSRTGLTFASGAPNPAGTVGGAASWLLWGNLTGVAVNYDEVNNQPPDGQYSYVFDATVNHEDLYTFTPLSLPAPATIYAVAVKAYVQKSDSGTRTVSLRTKSGATDSAGSLAGQALGTTFGWLGSFFPTDPNTGSAWLRTNLDAATSGLTIDA